MRREEGGQTRDEVGPTRYWCLTQCLGDGSQKSVGDYVGGVAAHSHRRAGTASISVFVPLVPLWELLFLLGRE